MIRIHHITALVSGCFAALSSTLGKICFNNENFDNFVSRLTKVLPTYFHHVESCLWWLVVLLFVLCNVAMWITFSRAMSESPNTIEVTSVNSAVNFLLSTLIGVILFNEVLSLSWCCGILLIGVGLYVIHVSRQPEDSPGLDISFKKVEYIVALVYLLQPYLLYVSLCERLLEKKTQKGRKK